MARTLTRPLMLATAVITLLALLLVSCAAPAASPTTAPAATQAPALATATPFAPSPTPAATPATQSGQPAQKITLKVADSFPTTHFASVHAAVPWMNRVKELTGGKVEFQHYPAEQLGKYADLTKNLRSGVVDIAYTPTVAGDFPLHSVFNFPGMYDTSTEGTRIYQELLKEGGPLREEFTRLGFRPLFNWANLSYEMFSAKKAVVRLEDINGLKIRTLGGAQDLLIRAFGAAPVEVASPDITTAMERGTIDACLLPYTSGASYKLDEVSKHVTLSGRFSGATLGYTISEKVWQGLPADVQQAMTTASEEILAAIVKYQDDQRSELSSKFEQKGVQVNEVPADEAARIMKAAEPTLNQWAQDMQAKGLPGQKVIDAWNKASGQ